MGLFSDFSLRDIHYKDYVRDEEVLVIPEIKL
jgi:hypothetical protein